MRFFSSHANGVFSALGKKEAATASVPKNYGEPLVFQALPVRAEKPISLLLFFIYSYCCNI